MRDKGCSRYDSRSESKPSNTSASSMNRKLPQAYKLAGSGKQQAAGQNAVGIIAVAGRLYGEFILRPDRIGGKIAPVLNIEYRKK